MAKWLLGILWAIAFTAYAPSTALAAGDTLVARQPGSLSVSTTVSGCTFTVDVTWSGFTGGNDTLEVFLLQVYPPLYDGLILEPSVFVHPVKGKSGSVSVTLPAIAQSATPNYFRGAAQLRDSQGAVISQSMYWSDVVFAYCNGL